MSNQEGTNPPTSNDALAVTPQTEFSGPTAHVRLSRPGNRRCRVRGGSHWLHGLQLSTMGPWLPWTFAAEHMQHCIPRRCKTGRASWMLSAWPAAHSTAWKRPRAWQPNCSPSATTLPTGAISPLSPAPSSTTTARATMPFTPIKPWAARRSKRHDPGVFPAR